MSSLQLQISPIGDGLSLKARTYDALRAAILDMNIYDPDAELRLDEDHRHGGVQAVFMLQRAALFFERDQPRPMRRA